MMVNYKESFAETQAQAQKLADTGDLKESFVNYPELRYLNKAKSSTKKKAIYLYKNGDSYDGKWKGGRPDGTGIYTFSNGDMYIGNFKSAQLDGIGMFRSFAKGYVYEGEFKYSAKHGRGILTNKSWDIQKGIWVNGELDGNSIVTTRDLRVIELTYKNGEILSRKLVKMEGIGVALEFNKESRKYFISALGNKMPAQIAGVKMGDILVSANGVYLSRLNNKEVVQRIKGAAGTIVKLKIMRDGNSITIPVTRGSLDVEELQRSTVKSKS
jgi:hypothetical protein